MSLRILVIGDESELRNSLLDRLQAEGYQAEAAGDLDVIYSLLEENDFDLVLLDSDRDPEGIELLDLLHTRHPETRLIILAGTHSAELTTKAIRVGVVDYIQKPFQFSAVLEGINRVLQERDSISKREALIRGLASTVEQLKDVEGLRRDELPARRTLKLPGGLLIDLERRQIRKAGQQVGLTPTESNLLSVFIENRERVLNHDELVTLLQGVKVDPEEAPEILRPMVSRLRKKLARFPGAEKWVKNIRGTGYLFDPT